MILNSIKSKHILSKIIKEHLQKKIYLKILRHNKILQSRLNITLGSYNEFSQIIFELIPVNQLQKEKNYFINPRGNELFFHIYLNENKNELNRFYITEQDNVDIIKVKIDYQFKNIYELFKDCICLKEIKLIQFNRSDFTDMSNMFKGCMWLTNLDINVLKTNYVTNMASMFNGC